ncbi:acyltransferase 3 [Hyphomicrobium denitrificans 1NES1]|uniref:Acyltransferase 3 n=1 Tax=Hyphomicrobium denitrificans 1NES1 TaxID=670307 RepID=N0B4A3_9HYPH|nr:acyltransferase family protein [Hyphomicrobium denitrificans]AGK58359.1 acyltransferase 3 [Hyphomicrobium denitrificans 1NES1]
MSNRGRGTVQTRSFAAKTHRLDIDGLRGLAVAGVVAYHFGLGVPGGYGGVDIFFVISGFLIAGIIKSELDVGSFSLAGFYVRRIRRILPALVVMAVVTTLFAAAVLFPVDLKAYGRSLLGVATSTSNYVFAHETGYFNGPATGKPLLHTWSLSVEEQFYLAFPLLLAVVYRWRRDAAVAVLVLIALLSFAYSVRQVDLRPERAFFVTPTRIWELLAGVLLALGVAPRFASRVLRESAAAAGIALILFGYFYFTNQTPFPGIAAVPLCLGAVLVIYAGSETSAPPTVVARFLSLPPAVGIGLVSYSIYLWHWPLMVLVRYRFPDVWQGEATGHLSVGLAFAAASTALGALSWRFVEQPFRQSRLRNPPRSAFASAALSIALLASLAFWLTNRPGWFHNWPNDIRPLLAEWGTGKGPSCASHRVARGWPAPACLVGASDVAADTVLWGDSHATALLSSVAAYGAAHDRAIIIASYLNCPPLADAVFYGAPKNNHCHTSVDELMKRVMAPDVRRVVIVARWAMYAEGENDGREVFLLSPGPRSDNAPVFSALLEATVKRIAAKGREVVLLGPIPEQTDNIAAAFARHYAWGQSLPPEPTLAMFLNRQRHVLPVLQRLEAVPNVRVVYPHSALCDDKVCHYSKDGAPLYRDTNHLNRTGAAAISGIIAQVFSDASSNGSAKASGDRKPLATLSGTGPSTAVP